MNEKIKQMEIIIEPIFTEKSMSLVKEKNAYTFKVSKKANKIEIKNAVEYLFNVHVVKVRTINVLPKKKTVGKYSGFKPAYKKAIVQLVEGEKIQAFDLGGN